MPVFLRNKPVFLFLLPLFFILHGFIQHYNSIPERDALLLLLLYSATAVFITWIAWLFYRNLLKASFFVFFLMSFYFFFGKVQDLLTRFFPGVIFSQYRFILPASLLLFFLLIIWLRKRKKPLSGFNLYANILLIVFIVIDTVALVTKIDGVEKTIVKDNALENRIIPDSCRKPDIYLLLMDQYASSVALKEIFHFDNSSFDNELDKLGFYLIRKSSSNYNLTPFSMASILDMDYLSPEMGVRKKLNVGYSYKIIKQSSVINFLTRNGYDFYNYSVLDFPGKPAHKYGAFLPYGTKLITAQTFINRITRDIRTGILEGKFGMPSLRKKIAYQYLDFNENIFSLTEKIATNKSNKPKFIYSHFMMPHFPYYFDSKGKPVPIEKLTGFRQTNSTDYIEYLQYGNKKILELINHILTNSPSPPVIILLSDHGFRNPDRKTDHKYDFMNLNALYVPGKNYSSFADTLSTVNEFRMLFNNQFNLQLPLLKDSTIDLWD